MPPGTDLTYSWSQALADLGQIAPIVALVGFFLFAVVVDLVLPRSRRGGAVAMFAVTGFALSLLTAGFWGVFPGGRAPRPQHSGPGDPPPLFSGPFSRPRAPAAAPAPFFPP